MTAACGLRTAQRKINDISKLSYHLPLLLLLRPAHITEEIHRWCFKNSVIMLLLLRLLLLLLDRQAGQLQLLPVHCTMGKTR